MALSEATSAVLADQSLVPPPDLRERIMSVLRAEIRRSDRLPLPPSELGPVDVSELAVAVVLRFAADTVEGVRARRCRLLSPSADSSRPGALEVEMSIALRYGPEAVIDQVDKVRARVIAAASAQVGLIVSRVDIQVADVYSDDE